MNLRPARVRMLERKQELEVYAKKSLGQNFLVSDHVVGKILQAVEDQHPQSLLEIGPGLGALTDGLVQMNCPLKLIELDSVFSEFWRSQKQEVVEVDALQWSWDLSQEARPCVLVSNLPYQISSSLVVDRSVDQNPLDAMILMFQKEVAQRMKATHKQGPYGFLSVLAQTFWQVDLLLEASSHDFFPPPKVASRVLVFKKKNPVVKNRRDFLFFLKACFSHPRKLLASNLAAAYHISKEEMRNRLVSFGFDPQIRSEQIAIDKFLEIYPSFERQV